MVAFIRAEAAILSSKQNTAATAINTANIAQNTTDIKSNGNGKTAAVVVPVVPSIPTITASSGYVYDTTLSLDDNMTLAKAYYSRRITQKKRFKLALSRQKAVLLTLVRQAIVP